MKKILGILVVSVLILSLLNLPGKAEGGYWKLNNVSEGRMDKSEHSSFGDSGIISENYEIHSGGGSMETKKTYQGKEYTIKSIHTFKIPEIFLPGETFIVELTVVDASSSDYPSSMQHFTRVNFPGITSTYAMTKIFTPSENPGADMTQASAKAEIMAPQKSDSLTVTFRISSGGGASGDMVIDYNYIFVEYDSANNTSEPKATDTVKLEDAGCIFSDLCGQVEVLNPIGYDENGEPIYDEEDWHFAKLDEPLYVGTKIKTGLGSYGEKSAAIISFADMSTFVMPEQTTIELVSPTHKESKIKLAMGNIWCNIKKMVTDGTMDIEMSQAVAGIKGTIFVCEVKADGTSTLKVIEGEVQFTDKTTGEITSVTSGKMIAAGAQEIPLSDFDIQAEYEDWLKYDSDLAISNKSNSGAIIVVLVIVFVALICCAFVIYIVKRKKLQPVGFPCGTTETQSRNPIPHEPINQTNKPAAPENKKFCANCGAPVKPDAKFCGGCGAKL